MALKETLDKLAKKFAEDIVSTIKNSSFADIAQIQSQAISAMRAAVGKKRGRKPGRKPAKPGRRGKKAATAKAAKVVRKKRKNYPKCVYPGCSKNRFVRGGGYCGDHWRKYKNGEIGPASDYKEKK